MVNLKYGHCSLYILQLEQNTPFFKKYSQNPELLPNEDEIANMYELAQNDLGKNGYEQYEVSNFAKKGF